MWAFLADFQLPRYSTEEAYLDFCEPWHRLVEIYTISQLIRLKDKLIAVSGLAKEVTRLINNQQSENCGSGS